MFSQFPYSFLWNENINIVIQANLQFGKLPTTELSNIFAFVKKIMILTLKRNEPLTSVRKLV